jgi:hypothetical protein
MRSSLPSTSAWAMGGDEDSSGISRLLRRQAPPPHLWGGGLIVVRSQWPPPPHILPPQLLAQSSSSSLSSSSLPPDKIDVDIDIASSRRHRLAQWSPLLSSLSSSLPPVDADVASFRHHCLTQSSLSLSSSPLPVNIARQCWRCIASYRCHRQCVICQVQITVGVAEYLAGQHQARRVQIAKKALRKNRTECDRRTRQKRPCVHVISLWTGSVIHYQQRWR